MTDSFRSPIFRAPGLKIKPKKFFTDTDIKPGQEAELFGKLDELITVIRQDNQIEKEKLDIEKKEREREKREKRENRIENLGKFFKGAGANLAKAAAPMTGFFDSLKRFLFFTILGGLITPLYNFLTNPENMGKIEATAKFLKDWWPALAIAAGAFLVPFKGLIIGTIAIATKGIIALGGLMLANPLLSAAVIGGIGAVYALLQKQKPDPLDPLKRSKEENMNEYGGGFNQSEPFGGLFSGGGMHLGTDTVPAMLTPGEFVMSRGAVNKFGVDFMESVNAMGGGTNRPKFGRVAYAAGGGLLDFIGSGEGTYESMNQGTNKDGKIVGSALNSTSKLGKKLTDMTIGEIRQRQRYIMDYSNPQVGDYGIFAAGKYQIIPSNMNAALRGTGLTDKDMFSPANQDIMGMNLLMNKAGREKLSAYLRGKSNDIIGAQTQLAQEFASVPVPIDMMGAYGPVKAGQSYYAGDGNRAGHSVAETRAALEKERKTNLSSRTGPKTKVSRAPTAPPVVSGIGPMMGPAFGDDTTAYAQAAKTELGKLGRFIFDATGARDLFHMIKDKLPVGTPNMPVSTETIILPTIKADVSGPKTEQVDNSIPEFEIASGVQMRGLVGKALGIDDLVGV